MGLVNAVFKDVERTTDCPTCEVEAGEGCVNGDDEPTAVHYMRFQEYLDRLGDRFTKRVAKTGPPRNGRRAVWPDKKGRTS